jgi:hypothetical protein
MTQVSADLSSTKTDAGIHIPYSIFIFKYTSHAWFRPGGFTLAGKNPPSPPFYERGVGGI